jgi:hypothetical protein
MPRKKSPVTRPGIDPGTSRLVVVVVVVFPYTALTGFYNRDGECLLRGHSIILKGLQLKCSGNNRVDITLRWTVSTVREQSDGQTAY